MNEYFESIDAENEPEKIFEQLNESLSIYSDNDNFYFSIISYSLLLIPDNDKERELNNKWQLNKFILRKVDNKYVKFISNYSINFSSNDILKVTSKYNSCIARILNNDNTLKRMIIRLDRKTLIELDCNKYAQLIKESLNDYYYDILSRTRKQRLIMDKEIFKN